MLHTWPRGRIKTAKKFTGTKSQEVAIPRYFPMFFTVGRSYRELDDRARIEKNIGYSKNERERERAREERGGGHDIGEKVRSEREEKRVKPAGCRQRHRSSVGQRRAASNSSSTAQSESRRETGISPFFCPWASARYWNGVVWVWIICFARAHPSAAAAAPSSLSFATLGPAQLPPWSAPLVYPQLPSWSPSTPLLQAALFRVAPERVVRVSRFTWPRIELFLHQLLSRRDTIFGGTKSIKGLFGRKDLKAVSYLLSRRNRGTYLKRELHYKLNITVLWLWYLI